MPAQHAMPDGSRGEIQREANGNDPGKDEYDLQHVGDRFALNLLLRTAYCERSCRGKVVMALVSLIRPQHYSIENPNSAPWWPVLTANYGCGIFILWPFIGTTNEKSGRQERAQGSQVGIITKRIRRRPHEQGTNVPAVGQ
jgi:hypothetical protein